MEAASGRLNLKKAAGRRFYFFSDKRRDAASTNERSHHVSSGPISTRWQRLFITGGSRGLGREMALAIADAGADVVLVGRELDSLDGTASEIRQRGRQVAVVQADVGIPAEAERACREALEQHGPIDIVINNVGGRRIDIPTQELPLEKWQQILDLNLTSTFLCTKILGGAMVSRARADELSMWPQFPGWSPTGESAAAVMKRARRLSFNSLERWRPTGHPSRSLPMPFARADL